MRTKMDLRNRIFEVFVYGAVGVIMAFVLAFLYPLVAKGLPHLSWAFLTEEPRRSGRLGGISSILMANALILIVCMVVAIPLSLGTALFLAEFGHRDQRLTPWIRNSLDVLAGVPSIVFGMFGNAFFCKILGLGFSIAAGGLTLACMVLPILTRTIEESLRVVPESYRLAGASLGLTKRAMIRHILLPMALPGAAIGFVLAMGRALAETAALIFTSGYVDRMPESLMDSGRTLAVHIYDLSMNVAGGDSMAFASSLVLVSSLILMNRATSFLARRWHVHRLRA